MRFLAVVALLLAGAADAHAFTIGSGGGNACHEWMTVEAWYAAACTDPLDCALPDAWRAVAPDAPPDAVTLRVVRGQLGRVIPDAEWEHQLAFFSLQTGTRYNDLHGHAISEFAELRAVHLADEHQAEHCTRGRDDDGPDGDRLALARCRGFIESELREARAAFDAAPGARLLPVPVYLEFYGTTQLAVWGGFFHLGRALHALQDLYAHTLRSDDTATIFAVANFVECETGDYDALRDGPCHSTQLDHCADLAAELGDAAEGASIDLVAAFFADPSAAATAAVLDESFRYRAGCTIDNRYCDTRWYPISLIDAATVGDAWFFHTFDCSAGRRAGPLGLAPVALALWLARRRTSAAMKKNARR